MISIFRSMLGLLMGMALAVYGLVQTFTRYPGSEPFTALAERLPALGAVLLFGLGILAIVLGAAVLVGSTRRLRRQWRQLRLLTERRRDYLHDDEYATAEGAWAGGHR